MVVVAHVETEHHSSGLSQFTKRRRRILHMPRDLTVGVSSRTSPEFRGHNAEIVSRHGWTVVRGDERCPRFGTTARNAAVEYIELGRAPRLVSWLGG